MVLESMPTWFRNLMYALALSTSFELIYYLNSARRAKNKSKKDEEDGLDVVFFPDQTRACEAYFTYGCNNGSCWLSHEMTSSMKVISFLEQAQKTLDICVYCIASQELVESVLKAHESGIVVRVITDQAQALEQEGQIGKLRSAGIEVRLNDSTFFMHHKFAVSDNKQLMNGSFNWSRNAMLGNNENVMFIGRRDIVTKFQSVFESLWEKYKP